MTDESAPEQPTPYARLASSAEAAQSFGVFVMLAGVIGGGILAIYDTDDTNPYLAEGVSLAVSALIVGVVVRLLGVWAAAWVWHAEGDA
jgi:hypothetical protein